MGERNQRAGGSEIGTRSVAVVLMQLQILPFGLSIRHKEKESNRWSFGFAKERVLKKQRETKIKKNHRGPTETRASLESQSFYEKGTREN